MAVLLKNFQKCKKTTTTDNDQEGRVRLIEMKLNKKVFVIGIVYAPTKDEPGFLVLFLTIVNFSKHDLTLSGD